MSLMNGLMKSKNGFLNFVNTITALIIIRRREFAMLESVGMTGTQLCKMLYFEGLSYMVLTLVFTLTAGVGLGYLIVLVMAVQTWFFVAYFTVVPAIYCAVPLFAICASVPLICYKMLMQSSLVERLRTE